jgi:hypothetical protein
MFQSLKSLFARPARPAAAPKARLALDALEAREVPAFLLLSRPTYTSVTTVSFVPTVSHASPATLSAGHTLVADRAEVPAALNPHGMLLPAL